MEVKAVKFIWKW